MSQLVRAGQSGAVDVAGDQATAKQQLAALVDMLRQLGGNASVVSGSAASADPLNAPFTLYVDPYIGSDRFVGGAYNSHEATGTDEAIIAQKLKRIELQRLECGYTSSRPFKTINRAAIEAAIITSKNWYTYTDPRAHVDCVTIVLSGGVHIVYNGPGSSSTSLTSWGASKDPTIAELEAFNPVTGGVLLPRGCSMHGQDLRKTTVRPDWVTVVEDEAADYSNRRSIFKVSGTGFFFNATTMDKIGHAESCHLLDTFQPASKAELDAFYLKVDSAVGSSADLATALLVARPSEYEIVGPIDQTDTPSSDWDTTRGASPYIFNWSVRSDYGMGGAFWDGSKIQGLKSMVCANFTGTNQQKDMRCWQVYESGNWVTLANTTEGYQAYINATPDNVRRNPARQTRHISAVKDAYIQKVSIFGIGQSEVTMVDSGGEITDNGGNSTFGGCSALAKGYKGFAFDKDQNWTVSRIKAPLNLSEKLSNIRRIDLGVIASVTSSAITLTNGLAISAESATVPAVLLAQGYSLANGTRIWVENPNGADWRATLTSTAWSSAAPTTINITGALQQAGTNAAAGNDAVGRRVYVRRVVDTRTVAERRVSLILNNTASARLPQRNAVLQTDPARSGGAISRVLTAGGEEVLLVTNAGTGPVPGSGVAKTSELTIRRGAANKEYAASTFYRIGTVVRHAGKHWQAKVTMTSSGSSPDPAFWGEVFVHMPSAFNPEDSVTQESPILILDTDTADTQDSTTLGINWTTVWTSAGPIRDQYRTGTDYLGVYAFLRAMGLTDTQAHAALVPKTDAGRLLDPNSATDFPDAPSGGAATGRGNWAVEFRRPSTIRLYNHQWEWAGFGNYSKAMPAVQQDMSEFNKFTYYFTNSGGGRVVPKGSNEDGFEVTPRGLEDIATGATISPEGLGGQSLEDIQRTDFPNGIQVGDTATVQDLDVQGGATWSDQSRAKTTREGVVRLATIAQLTAQGSAAPTVSTDTGLEGSPDAVTVQGLNRWALAQRFVRTSTDTINIFVKADAADRDLNSMLDTPPTSAATAIPTLARASEYANTVIGSGNQTAEIRMAPGFYDPGSIWQCNVSFVAFNAALTARIWQSNSVGTDSVANNYFDGSGYEDFANAVNFWTFTLALRGAGGAGNNLHVNLIPRRMTFDRSVDFIGGFHFLGLPELIKAEANSLRPSTITNFLAGSVALPGGSYSTNVTTNVDTLLSAIRVANNRTGSSNNPAYVGYTGNSLIALRGAKTDQARLRDLVFGPGLPSRKESIGGFREALISIEGDVTVNPHNIYIRGKTVVTSAGMGVTNNLPNADDVHYGSSVITTPWTWEQTYHSLFGTSATPQTININPGSGVRYNTNSSTEFAFSFYQDGTGKLLPNHIHLLTSAGAVPGNDDDGPYFDQFIHAPIGINLISGWAVVGESQGLTLSARGQGFVGKFGRNGYNTVKTRGLVGGNAGVRLPEHGFSITAIDSANGRFTAIDGRSLFRRAGIAQSAADTTVQPAYVAETPTEQGFGLANPSGDNPVITTDTSGNAALNVGLRSYRRGISTEFAITIQPTNIIM
jgi:hypothetical protein